MNDPEAMDGGRTRRFDPLATAAAGFFALALMFAAYPAIRAGSATMGGLLLLLGLAGVAVFTILALRGNGGEAAPEGLDPDALVLALGEPACVVTSDGRITGVNPAWEARSARSAGCPSPPARPASSRP